MSFQIETERLILRDVQQADLPVLLAQAREPEAQRGILTSQASELYNRQAYESAMRWAREKRRRYYTLAVVRKDDRALIGSCSIAGVERGSIETSLGWHFGARFWGKGYATEAARVLLFIGFEIGGAAEIYADCFADNYASIRVMEKIGMTTRQNLRLFNQIRGWSYGEERPTVRYTISRNEWLLKVKSE